MKTRIGIFISALLVTPNLNAEDKSSHYGIELDVLPYVAGGYYGSIWASKQNWRARLVHAMLQIPEFAVQDGFEKNKLQASAFIVDYFFNPGLEGVWIGGGAELWNGEISESVSGQSDNYQNWVATVGGGYVWRFYKGFYLNPWVAGHLPVAGDKDIVVGGKEFKTRTVSGEVSLKLGWVY